MISAWRPATRWASGSRSRTVRRPASRWATIGHPRILPVTATSSSLPKPTSTCCSYLSIGPTRRPTSKQISIPKSTSSSTPYRCAIARRRSRCRSWMSIRRTTQPLPAARPQYGILSPGWASTPPISISSSGLWTPHHVLRSPARATAATPSGWRPSGNRSPPMNLATSTG